MRFRVAGRNLSSSASRAAPRPCRRKRSPSDAMTPVPAADGARIILLPENFGFMGSHGRDKLAVREPEGEGPQQTFLAQAAGRHGIFVIGGSVPLACPDPDRIKQSLLVYGPDGTPVAR